MRARVAESGTGTESAGGGGYAVCLFGELWHIALCNITTPLPPPALFPCTGSPRYMAYIGIDPLRGGACRLARDWILSLLQ